MNWDQIKAWLQQYWYVPAIVVGVIVVLLVTKSFGKAKRSMRRRMARVRAARKKKKGRR